MKGWNRNKEKERQRLSRKSILLRIKHVSTQIQGSGMVSHFYFSMYDRTETQLRKRTRFNYLPGLKFDADNIYLLCETVSFITSWVTEKWWALLRFIE